jgi:hypothetical protein
MPESTDVPAHNFTFLAHSDQGGRADGVQVIVHKGHAYIGHLFSNGVTVLDVSDTKNPRPVYFIPAPPGTWSIHLQTHEDLLLVNNAVNAFAGSAGRVAHAAGLRVFDISSPSKPREIGFMPVEGRGVHRTWYVGGRYAYVSAALEGFTGAAFMVVDMADPTKPEPVGKWWIPGMWKGGGETPTWGEGKRFSLHHPVVAGTTAYGGWTDGGLTLLDVSEPNQPQLISHLNWSPPFGGGTHSALPLPDRNLVIVADEANADHCADQLKYVWVVDIREPTNPVTIATFPTPQEEDYCAKGGHFGPHNLHENRPGSFRSSELIFATYQNAGVRVFDIRNPFQPRQVGYFVPPPPERMYDPRPNQSQATKSCDVFVDTEGIAYVTDWNGGLNILEYTG